jgi:hypothetical protein
MSVGDPGTVLRRRSSPEVEEVTVGTETVVYDAGRRSLHVLDPVGSLIWQALDGETSLEQVNADLALAFGRAEVEVSEDVHLFAAQLLELGLVDPAG